MLSLLLLAAVGISRSALAVSGTTWLVSHAPDGSTALAGARGDRPSVSRDGRYVAFISNARNFGVDTGGTQQVFVRDLQWGTTTLVSVSSGGVPADRDCWRAAISADGRHVAFCSPARNLTPGLNPVAISTFVRDLDSSRTELVSVDSQEVEPTAFSGTESLAINADGRFVAFTSDAADLAPGDTNHAYDVFVRDRAAGTTELGSVEPAGAPSDNSNGTMGLALSEDGRYLAFHSQETSLIGLGGRHSIYLRDRLLATTETVSVSGAGVEGDGPSAFPSRSADGRYVAFRSDATNLVSGDTNHYADVFVRDRTGHATVRASVTSEGAQGTHESTLPTLSPDGRYVAFWSGSPNFVPELYTPFWDVYVHDLETGSTELASLGNGGEIADQGSAYATNALAVSQGGKRVIFASRARNLVAGDTDGQWDVFVRDRSGAATERVSVGAGGTEGITSAQSSNPALSGDGRYVAFVSNAFNLVDGDTNGEPDVFVWDRVSGVTERVSVSSDGSQANAPSGATEESAIFASPAISTDGRYVAFSSWAANLVPNDRNDWGDVFLRDRVQGRTERVSLRADGSQVISVPEQTPALSADGRYVAFVTPDAAVPSDENGNFDVYVRDRALQTVALVSGGDSASFSPAVSSDGRYVAFESWSANLVPGDSNGVSDVFVRDRLTSLVERVSLTVACQQSNGGSYAPSLSADGQFVAFSSDATNLLGGGLGGWRNVFVRDRTGGTTEQVNLADGTLLAAGTPADYPRLSADGRYVAFSAFADDLVEDDTNSATDVFVRDRSQQRTERVSVAAEGSQGNPTPNFYRLDVPAISNDGRYVAFQSDAPNLVDPDHLPNLDVFLRDRGSLSALQPPAAVTAQLVAPLRVRLTWSDPNLNENHYRIQRRTAGEPAFSSLVTLGADVTTYEDATPVPGVTYLYRVVATNAGGESLPSNPATVSVPAVPFAPDVAPPTPLAGSGLRLTWSSSGEGILSFEVARSADNGLSWTAVATLDASVTTLDDTGLLPDHGYRYRVRALGLGGNSPFGYAEGWTLPSAPPAPTDLQATGLNALSVTLSWSRPSGSVTGYVVEGRSGAGKFTEINATLSELLYVSGLTPDTSYSFRVRAYNEGGYSTPSTVLDVSTPGMAGKLGLAGKKLNFGTVRLGKGVQRALVIQNTSRTVPLWLTAPTAPGPFSLSGSGVRVLAPGEKWKALFTFTPAAKGTATQTWTLTSSDPQRRTNVITLTGKGK